MDIRKNFKMLSFDKYSSVALPLSYPSSDKSVSSSSSGKFLASVCSGGVFLTPNNAVESHGIFMNGRPLSCIDVSDAGGKRDDGEIFFAVGE